MKKRWIVGVACLMSVSLSACGTKGQAGGKQEIMIYTRDASSGTREAFEKGVGFVGKLSKNANETVNNDDMAAKVGSDVNGIGYTSRSTNFDKNNVKALRYEGIVASEETVLDGTYQLQRPFNFVTRASGDYESSEKEELVIAFLDFLQNSKEGRAIVKRNGGEVDVEQGAIAWAELATKYPVLKQDNRALTLSTCGSTSVDKTVKASLEAFRVLAGNVKFVMNHNGSSDAVQRVLGSEKDGANRADIGFASRAFKSDGSEDVSKALLQGQYCIDAVVAIVHKDNVVDSLTQQQLKDIFTGTLSTWDGIQ